MYLWATMGILGSIPTFMGYSPIGVIFTYLSQFSMIASFPYLGWVSVALYVLYYVANVSNFYYLLKVIEYSRRIFLMLSLKEKSKEGMNIFFNILASFGVIGCFILGYKSMNILIEQIKLARDEKKREGRELNSKTIADSLNTVSAVLGNAVIISSWLKLTIELCNKELEEKQFSKSLVPLNQIRGLFFHLAEAAGIRRVKKTRESNEEVDFSEYALHEYSPICNQEGFQGKCHYKTTMYPCGEHPCKRCGFDRTCCNQMAKDYMKYCLKKKIPVAMDNTKLVDEEEARKQNPEMSGKIFVTELDEDSETDMVYEDHEWVIPDFMTLVQALKDKLDSVWGCVCENAMPIGSVLFVAFIATIGFCMYKFPHLYQQFLPGVLTNEKKREGKVIITKNGNKNKPNKKGKNISKAKKPQLVWDEKKVESAEFWDQLYQNWDGDEFDLADALWRKGYDFDFGRWNDFHPDDYIHEDEWDDYFDEKDDYIDQWGRGGDDREYEEEFGRNWEQSENMKNQWNEDHPQFAFDWAALDDEQPDDLPDGTRGYVPGYRKREGKIPPNKFITVAARVEVMRILKKLYDEGKLNRTSRPLPVKKHEGEKSKPAAKQEQAKPVSQPVSASKPDVPAVKKPDSKPDPNSKRQQKLRKKAENKLKAEAQKKQPEAAKSEDVGEKMANAFADAISKVMAAQAQSVKTKEAKAPGSSLLDAPYDTPLLDKLMRVFISSAAKNQIGWGVIITNPEDNKDYVVIPKHFGTRVGARSFSFYDKDMNQLSKMPIEQFRFYTHGTVDIMYLPFNPEMWNRSVKKFSVSLDNPDSATIIVERPSGRADKPMCWKWSTSQRIGRLEPDGEVDYNTRTDEGDCGTPVIYHDRIVGIHTSTKGDGKPNCFVAFTSAVLLAMASCSAK